MRGRRTGAAVSAAMLIAMAVGGGGASASPPGPQQCGAGGDILVAGQVLRIYVDFVNDDDSTAKSMAQLETYKAFTGALLAQARKRDLIVQWIADLADADHPDGPVRGGVVLIDGPILTTDRARELNCVLLLALGKVTMDKHKTNTVARVREIRGPARANSDDYGATHGPHYLGLD
jgi:hypothetical protein